MKKSKLIVVAILMVTMSCRKNEQDAPRPDRPTSQHNSSMFTLREAQNWLSTQDTALSLLKPVWNTARKLTKQDAWLVRVPGSPIYQNVRQGSRKLLVRKDTSGTLSARMVEIIPDAYTLQEFGKMPDNKFSGRILIFRPDHQLESGRLLSSGKITGEIKGASSSRERLAGIKGGYANLQAALKSDQLSYRVYAMCSWQDYGYVDGTGVFTVHSERSCDYQILDDYYFYEIGYGAGNYEYPPDRGGGGGYNSNPTPAPEPEPEIPAPSNLPGEDNPSVDPKKMMECFKAVSGPNAAYQVKVHVQEPFPGTSFNLGPNSYGHVAIELTVNNGNQTITQVIGFYPSGSGADKMVSPSRIVNNGDMAWDVSATYYVSQSNFQNIVNFAASPPEGYHFMNYNCTAFVYTAATLGGIDLPMGFTTVGLAGPGGVTTAQTPAGLGSELRAMKTANPKLNISGGGGRASASKGECN